MTVADVRLPVGAIPEPQLRSVILSLENIIFYNRLAFSFL